MEINTIANNLRKNGRLDVVKLANELNIRVLPFNDFNTLFDKESAFIRNEEDNFVIYVNPNQSKQRQRFSIAHEIGHFINHKDEILAKGKVDRSSVDSLCPEKEKEADQFAAELLMPKDDLVKYISENDYNGQKAIKKNVIEILAERYDVSFYAMIVRLRELGYYVPYIDVFSYNGFISNE